MHLDILCQTVYREDCIQRIATNLTRRDLLLRLGLAQSFCLIGFAQTTPVVPLSDADLLQQLRTTHPRLILTDADFDRIRLLTRENTLARRIYSDLEKECDRLLSTPPVEYKLVGPR